MAEITRKKQLVFGDGLTAQNNIAKYGSKKQDGTMAFSDDIEDIESVAVSGDSNTAWQLGLTGAVTPTLAPRWEDMNALFYVITKQLAYLFQKGVPEWNNATEYFANKSFVSYGGLIYIALQDSTNKNPSTETTYWGEYKSVISQFNSTISTAIGGYPKGARLLYKNYNEAYYIESVKDNNTDEPNETNIFKPINTVNVLGVISNSSELPTASEYWYYTKKFYYCTGDKFFYTCDRSYNPISYYWVPFDTGLFNYAPIIDKNLNNIYLYNTTTSQYESINQSQIYSWISLLPDTNYIFKILNPNYNAGVTKSANTSYTPTNNVFVVINCSGGDTNLGNFVVGNTTVMSWNIMGASTSKGCIFPIKAGDTYRYNQLGGNVTITEYPTKKY